jgi:hypothetical protein
LHMKSVTSWVSLTWTIPALLLSLGISTDG